MTTIGSSEQSSATEGPTHGGNDSVSNPHVDPRLVNAFFGLQLGGELGMFIIVLTAIGSPHVKRNSTWYTFCFAWILSCISYTFIFRESVALSTDINYSNVELGQLSANKLHQASEHASRKPLGYIPRRFCMSSRCLLVKGQLPSSVQGQLLPLSRLL